MKIMTYKDRCPECNSDDIYYQKTFIEEITTRISTPCFPTGFAETTASEATRIAEFLHRQIGTPDELGGIDWEGNVEVELLDEKVENQHFCQDCQMRFEVEDCQQGNPVTEESSCIQEKKITLYCHHCGNMCECK